MNITLREIQLKDLKTYEHWMQPEHQYHSLNGPYFKKQTSEEIKTRIAKMTQRLESENGTEGHQFPPKKLIVDHSDQLLGEVSWYWKSKETHWLEVGIVIYNEENWGKGIGTKAFKMWIQEVFIHKPEIVRIGLSTWSGNTGMIKLSERLGMKLEATIRQARIVDGQYYDSISYGILRSEFRELGRSL